MINVTKNKNRSGRGVLNVGRRIQMRSSNGRFRKSTLRDWGIGDNELQKGSAICANCGYGKEEKWHPILKTGYCPKCNSQEKL